MSVAGKLLTNDRLKAIMTDAFVARGLCTDVDSTYATGIYNMGDNTAGIQGFNNAKYGVLVVINQGTNIWFQCIIPWQCSYMLFRSGNKAGWHTWMRISLSSAGGVIYCPSLQKGGGLYEYGRKKSFRKHHRSTLPLGYLVCPRMARWEECLCRS